MPSGSRQIEMTWRCSSCSQQNLGRHQACQACGDPKDKSEKYEMPGATASAPSVTDPALLRLATAGPNWRCAFCGSDQRRLDDTCGKCGASIHDATAPHPAAPHDATVEPTARRPRQFRWGQLWREVRAHKLAVGIVGGVVALIALLVIRDAWVNRARDYPATVDAVQWQQTITVERYQIWQRESWRDDAPSDGFEVRSLGQRVHHYDDVLDGYDTQHYTARVACGQDCDDVPESCSESCSDNGNGFASCRTTCSGGGQRCSTRYCSEDRTRQVARYRKEARYAEAVAYRIWDWGDHRTVHAQGATVGDLRWPVAEAGVGAGLAPREQERERRSASYRVTLAYDGAARLTFEATLSDFAGFAPGTTHQLHLKRGRATVDGRPAPRVE